MVSGYTQQAAPGFTIIRAMTIRVAALYRFVALPDYRALRDPLLAQLNELQIKGTILLAEEGINGTIAGSPEAIDNIINRLRTATVWQGRLAELEVKYSATDEMPFARAKVKLKREIVTLGVTGIAPAERTGAYVDPADWNDLISRDDVITIDTRNDYEISIGQFRGATNPHTENFREFPDYAQQSLPADKTQKIAMYCTGGIRCEKSTAYLKSLGYEEVYHLRGGILKYLEEVPKEQSLWEGECFVFDERVAVDHDLQHGNYVQCHACRLPLTHTDLEHPRYEPGVSCHQCYDKKTDEQRARYRERQKQVRLAQARNEQHIGDNVAPANAARRSDKYDHKAGQRAKNQGS
jgi:UPF0176 protein